MGAAPIGRGDTRFDIALGAELSPGLPLGQVEDDRLEAGVAADPHLVGLGVRVQDAVVGPDTTGVDLSQRPGAADHPGVHQPGGDALVVRAFTLADGEDHVLFPVQGEAVGAFRPGPGKFHHLPVRRVLFAHVDLGNDAVVATGDVRVIAVGAEGNEDGAGVLDADAPDIAPRLGVYDGNGALALDTPGRPNGVEQPPTARVYKSQVPTTIEHAVRHDANDAVVVLGVEDVSAGVPRVRKNSVVALTVHERLDVVRPAGHLENLS